MIKDFFELLGGIVMILLGFCALAFMLFVVLVLLSPFIVLFIIIFAIAIVYCIFDQPNKEGEE